MIRHHLIRYLWDRNKPVLAGEDMTKVSGTTCTSPADATAKGAAGAPRACCVPALQKAVKAASPWAGLQPDPGISAAHLSPGWSPGGQGLPTAWVNGMFWNEREIWGKEYAPTSRADGEKRDLHCGKGTSAVQQAVPQTMLLSTSLQKAALLSTHPSPLLQTSLQHLITVPCWSIAGWSCCCWGKAAACHCSHFREKVNGCGKRKGRDRRGLHWQEARERS